VPKNRCQIPRPYGAGIAVLSGVVVFVSDGFPLVVRLWLLAPYRGWVVSVLQLEIIYGSVGALFRVLVGFLLVVSCIQWLAFRGGCIDQASTESLILAQDERWRRA
jgi:hypothetical protein